MGRDETNGTGRHNWYKDMIIVDGWEKTQYHVKKTSFGKNTAEK